MRLLVLISVTVMAVCGTSFSPSVYDYYDFVDIPRVQVSADDRSDSPELSQQTPREVRTADYRMESLPAIQSRYYRQPPPQPFRQQFRPQFNPRYKQEAMTYRQNPAVYRARPVYRQQSQGERPPVSRDRIPPQLHKKPRVPPHPKYQRPYVEEVYDDFQDYEASPQYSTRLQYQERPSYGDDLSVFEDEVHNLPLQYDNIPQHQDGPQYQDDLQYQEEHQFQDSPQYQDGPQYQEDTPFRASPQYQEEPQYEGHLEYKDSPQYHDSPQFDEETQYTRPQHEDTPNRPQYQDTPSRTQYQDTPSRPQYQDTPSRPQQQQHQQDRPIRKKRPTYEVLEESKKEHPKVAPGGFVDREEGKEETVKEKRHAGYSGGPHVDVGGHGGYHDGPHLDAAGKEFVADASAVEHGQTDGRLSFQIHGQQGPHSYRFGYDTGKGYNRQFRYEERDGEGQVHGRYGFYNDGKLQVVNYSAHPKHGFTADVPH